MSNTHPASSAQRLYDRWLVACQATSDQRSNLKAFDAGSAYNKAVWRGAAPAINAAGLAVRQISAIDGERTA